MAKYIIVGGGVISGVGKGITAASIALLLKSRGHSVTCIKLDPYLNIDAGILAPLEHGECYLCDDGTETDLDLGHYSRIADIKVSKRNICTAGTIHKSLIDEQENGKYLGQTIQFMPHLTDKIISRISSMGDDAEIVIAEIGGTIGDIESECFYKAVSQFKRSHRDDCLICLVSPILWVNTIKEHKTKPLQRSVEDLQHYGLHPDILFCRTLDGPAVAEKTLKKIAHLTNIPRSSIFDAPNEANIYRIAIEFYKRHVDDLIADKFKLKRNGCRIHKYRDMVQKMESDDLEEIEIGVVGKYQNCEEAYASLKEAVKHAGAANASRVKIRWISAEELEKPRDMRGVWPQLEGLHGLIVPGGFDVRGIEGKIRAIKYAREKSLPFLGICLGLHCAVIEFARDCLGLKEADSYEFNQDTPDPVIHYIPGQEGLEKKCGTMRLGAYGCDLEANSLTFKAYGKKSIEERHRHRYEVNSKYQSDFQEKGFLVTGINAESQLIETMELDTDVHPFFVGCQFHPEFKSTLRSPAPLFKSLIKASLARKHQEETVPES